MAAYRRVYDLPHLHADCQEPGSAPGPYARQSSMGYLYPPLPFFTSCGLVTVQHSEAWCRVVLPRPAAMAESSACERGNDVGQTSILDRRQFLQFAYCSEFIKRTSPCSASYISCQRGTARICSCGPALLWRFCCWTPNAGRSISPAHRALSSKPAARCCSGRSMGQTDGGTDATFFLPLPQLLVPLSSWFHTT